MIATACSYLGWVAGRAWSGETAPAIWQLATHRHPTEQPCALAELAAIGSRPDTSHLPFDQGTWVAHDRDGLTGGDIESALVACDIGSAIAVPVLAGADTGGILALYCPPMLARQTLRASQPWNRSGLSWDGSWSGNGPLL